MYYLDVRWTSQFTSLCCCPGPVRDLWWPHRALQRQDPAPAPATPAATPPWWRGPWRGQLSQRAVSSGQVGISKLDIHLHLHIMPRFGIVAYLMSGWWYILEKFQSLHCATNINIVIWSQYRLKQLVFTFMFVKNSWKAGVWLKMMLIFLHKINLLVFQSCLRKAITVPSECSVRQLWAVSQHNIASSHPNIMGHQFWYTFCPFAEQIMRPLLLLECWVSSDIRRHDVV